MAVELRNRATRLFDTRLQSSEITASQMIHGLAETIAARSRTVLAVVITAA